MNGLIKAGRELNDELDLIIHDVKYSSMRLKPCRNYNFKTEDNPIDSEAKPQTHHIARELNKMADWIM